MDIYNQAEELNQVSATYNVEIDGVPLQHMSTIELSKVRREGGDRAKAGFLLSCFFLVLLWGGGKA